MRFCREGGVAQGPFYGLCVFLTTGPSPDVWTEVAGRRTLACLIAWKAIPVLLPTDAEASFRKKRNHFLVGPIIRGEYQNVGTHHGKPNFMKAEKVGGVDVCICF